MKKLATISLIAASALILVPKPAVAGNSEIAAIGGFIGGLIVGSNINSQPNCAPVYYPAAPVGVYGADGYWHTNSIQVWVGPQWVMVVDHHNRPVRRLIDGHYETRSQRTWVSYNRNHREYGHSDRNDRHFDRHNRRSSDRGDRNGRSRNRY